MKNIIFFLSENFQFLEVKFSIYLNRRVFVMNKRNDPSAHLHGLIRACAASSQNQWIMLILMNRSGLG